MHEIASFFIYKKHKKKSIPLDGTFFVTYTSFESVFVRVQIPLGRHPFSQRSKHLNQFLSMCQILSKLRCNSLSGSILGWCMNLHLFLYIRNTKQKQPLGRRLFHNIHVIWVGFWECAKSPWTALFLHYIVQFIYTFLQQSSIFCTHNNCDLQGFAFVLCTKMHSPFVLSIVQNYGIPLVF